ncbi:MAG: chitobiase/beta-hexosaminidase C-terminal domain-containing protein, partial [Prevotella sp.]|nr:chitobiase/beta-hexosaminidase C-terminal domain-containing protein [Prevotella sp.]
MRKSYSVIKNMKRCILLLLLLAASFLPNHIAGGIYAQPIADGVAKLKMGEFVAKDSKKGMGVHPFRSVENSMPYGKLRTNTSQPLKAANGEVVDEHGIITSPGEGFRKKRYKRSGYSIIFSADFGNGQLIYYGGEQVNNHPVFIVESQDGTVYIQGIISEISQYSNPTETWVKGTKVGNTITIPGGQPVYYHTDEHFTMSVDWGESKGWNRSTGDITFNISGDVISLVGSSADKFIGIFHDNDNFFFHGDYETVWTFESDYVPDKPKVLCELPEGATVQNWYAKGTGSFSIHRQIKISFVNNDVYICGLYPKFPNSWIKGTISGNTVTFDSFQYLGNYRPANYDSALSYWGFGGNENSILDSFTMNYDAGAHVLKLDANQYMYYNAEEESIDYDSYIKELSISMDPPSIMPDYEVDFTIDSSSMDDFIVLDANGDGSTWNWSNSARYSYSTTNKADDYLILPIQLEKGKHYEISLTAHSKSSNYPEKFELVYGKEATADAMSHKLIEETTLTSASDTTFSATLTPDADGVYYIAVHAISDADQYYLYLKKFSVKEVIAYAQTVTFARDGNTLSMSTTTPNASIYYTLDGSTPTTSSTKYTGPITLTQNCTVKAIATAEGMENSSVTTYNVNWFKVESVNITFENKQVHLSTTTPDARIYYTLDGSTPTESSNLYTGPFSVSQNCTVTARAFKDFFNPSDMTSLYIDLGAYTCSAPTFNRDANVLTINSATENATIYYTLDGSTPTTASTKYAGPITLAQNCTVKAMATAEGYEDSEVTTYNVGWFKVESVVITYENKLVHLTTTTPDARIYYTLDGSTPTALSNKYTEPFSVPQNCTVTARAFKENLNPSDMTSLYIDLGAYTCSAPTFNRDANVLTINSATENATIYYT